MSIGKKRHGVLARRSRRWKLSAIRAVLRLMDLGMNSMEEVLSVGFLQGQALMKDSSPFLSNDNQGTTGT